MRKRDLEIAPVAAPHFLRLSPDVRWQLLEALDRLAADPYLRDLQEEDGEDFILVGSYVILVEVSDYTVNVLGLKKHMAN